MKEIMVKAWARQGSTYTQFPFFESPWEPFGIWLLGVQVAHLNLNAPRAMHTCQNSKPDIFAMSGQSQLDLDFMFQNGLYIPFPAAGGANPPHLDLHIEFGAFPYFFVYTAFYVEATP